MLGNRERFFSKTIRDIKDLTLYTRFSVSTAKIVPEVKVTSRIRIVRYFNSFIDKVPAFQILSLLYSSLVRDWVKSLGINNLNNFAAIRVHSQQIIELNAKNSRT